jgi:hypothetical protein
MYELVHCNRGKYGYDQGGVKKRLNPVKLGG